MIGYLKQIYMRLTTGSSTEEQAIQGGIWVAGINVSSRLLQLLKVVVLARLLSPEAFGLLGIALLVLSSLRRFSNLGFGGALIQHQEENINAYLNTAWTVKIVQGILIAAIAFFAAPYLGALFNEPRAVPLIQAIGASNLLLAFQNPAIIYFQKDLNFHKEFGYKLSARLADLGVAVGCALIYRSVWALVAGIAAMNFAQFILSYLILEYRPRIEFEIEYAKEMFGFGKWMFAQAILGFFLVDGDDAFVGWFFASSALGYYQISYRYSNAPATEFTQIIRRVAFPTFSIVQEDIGKLRSGFFRVVQLSSIVAFPVAAGIFVIAPQFVYIMFGEQWAPIIPLLQVLALWGAIRALIDSFRAVYKAVGNPEYISYLTLIQIICIAIAIYPAAEYFGVIGVGYVIVGQNVISLPIGILLALQIVEGELFEFLHLVFYPALASILMASTLIFIDMYLMSGHNLSNLLILVCLGILLYLIYTLILNKYTQYEFIQICRDLFQFV